MLLSSLWIENLFTYNVICSLELFSLILSGDSRFDSEDSNRLLRYHENKLDKVRYPMNTTHRDGQSVRTCVSMVFQILRATAEGEITQLARKTIGLEPKWFRQSGDYANTPPRTIPHWVWSAG